MRTLSVVLGAGALIGFGSGCFVTNTAHCGYHENGADNPCPVGYVCNVCQADNNGCVPEGQADSLEPQCRDSGTMSTSTAPSTVDTTDGPTTLPTETETTSTTEGTTIGVTTMGPTSTTETTTETTETSTTMAQPTTLETPCDPMFPKDPVCGEQYCVADGQCGWCNSLPEGTPCAVVDPNTPACDEVSGKCVECTPDEAALCTGNTPACDPETHTCVPCTEHSQCPNSACDIFEGSCFPEGEEAVFYVQGSNVDCGAKTGKTEDSPFCRLTNVPEVAKATIRLMSGSVAPGGLAIADGRAVAIVRHKPQMPDINGANILGPTLTVAGAARLYLSGVKLRFGVGSLVKCTTTSRVYAHDVWWDGNNINSALAIDAINCDVFVHRSRLTRLGAAMQLSAGTLWVENSFITDIGANPSLAAFNFKSGAKGTITYSTIARNRVVNGVSTFQCDGVPELVVRNSAVVGLSDVVEAECEPGVSFVNGRKEEVPDEAAQTMVMTKWFNAPVEDVYTPKKGADTLEGTATWQEGDPRKDFLNAAIPTDEPSFAGAKQPL